MDVLWEGSNPARSHMEGDERVASCLSKYAKLNMLCSVAVKASTLVQFSVFKCFLVLWASDLLEGRTVLELVIGIVCRLLYTTVHTS